MSVETKNAVIEAARIGLNERGFLECDLTLNYGGSCQGFGGFALHLPQHYTHHTLNTAAGEYIMNVLKIADVDDFARLVGRCIRVSADWKKVYKIGHIVREEWFDPAAMFAQAEKERGE